jgi:WhiB family redox-sensing transcriptional regulator
MSNPGARLIDVLRAEPQPWARMAACSQSDPALFFPGPGEPVRPGRRICKDCDCRTDCLAWALRNHQGSGIWGGSTGKDRERIQRGTLTVEAVERMVARA